MTLKIRNVCLRQVRRFRPADGREVAARTLIRPTMRRWPSDRAGGRGVFSLINSVGNVLVNPERESVVIKPKGGFGGLGGAMIKPVALANVSAFWKLSKAECPLSVLEE